jgi:hypothetical protein
VCVCDTVATCKYHNDIWNPEPRGGVYPARLLLGWRVFLCWFGHILGVIGSHDQFVIDIRKPKIFPLVLFHEASRCAYIFSANVLRVYRSKLTCSCDNRDNLCSGFCRVSRCCRSPSDKPCITAFYLDIRLGCYQVRSMATRYNLETLTIVVQRKGSTIRRGDFESYID